LTELYRLEGGRLVTDESTSFWKDVYGEIVFDERTGGLIYEYGENKYSVTLEVFQHGTSENSLVAFGVREGVVNNPRNYLLIQTFQPGQPFFWDHYGTLLAGECGEPMKQPN
jgi:hypothetical protein